jgi:[CysO sulfur-carrier protein]-S-L-cysteine hydrolase
MIAIASAALAAMHAHAVEGFPEEVCGVVFATPAGQIVRRLKNVQNELHASDPVANPRDARTAYSIDRRDLFEMERQAREPGWGIAIIYHSHPQHDAYFSPTDRAQASYTDPVDGSREPTYAGTSWLVVAVYDGVIRDSKLYAWDDDTRDFVGVDFEVTNDA